MTKFKLNDELCKAICDDIKAGVPVVHACVANGIGRTTFYRWYDRGRNAKSGKFKNFYDKVEEAKSEAIRLRAKRICRAGETTWQADAWWLERVDPDNFGKKDKREYKVDADVNVDLTRFERKLKKLDKE